MRKIKDLSEASNAALLCRTEGHETRWLTDRVTMDRRGKRVIEFDRIKKCRRCGYTMTKTVDARTWTVTKRTPGYPDDYLIAGQGRIPAADVYREQFSRSDFLG